MALKEIFFYLILPAAVFIYFFLKKKFSYFDDLGIPHMKPTWPLGNIKGMGSKMHFFDMLLKIYNECSGKDVLCGFYNFVQPIFVVNDPELAKAMLVKDFNFFVNRGQYYNEKDEPLTAHLFSIENDYWRFLRNKLSPVFTSGKLKAMYPIIIDKGDNLVAAIERDTANGRSIEVKNISSRFTCDVVSSVAFGMEANTLNHENERLIKLLKEIFGDDRKAMFRFMFMTAFPNFSKKIKMRLFSESLSDFFMNVVGGNIKHREDSNDNRKDFLNMLIQLKNKGAIDGEISSDVKKLTLNEIMAQAFLFFFAGSETTSTTISFALAELSNNQEAQNKLRKEIEEKIKETKGEITYEALNEMNYLGMVVNESLRMYSPALLLNREALKDYPVPNSKHIIPKGSQVWINNQGIQCDEKYYPNPTKFDPERFTQEEINKRPQFTWLPFGEGPRNCIGMRFGLLNAKLGLAYVIKNFKVTPDPQLKFPIKVDPKKIAMEPIGGFMLKFQKI